MSGPEEQRRGPDLDLRDGPTPVVGGAPVETARVEGGRVDGAAAAAPVSPFAGVTGRRTVDALLQTMTQDLVALSGQADLKASIMITASSIVVSVSITATRYSQVRWSLVTLSVFAVAALANAILAVLPRHRSTRVGVGSPPQPVNPLYFAHAATVGADDYVRQIAGICAADATVYEAITRQVHALSFHLEHRKFRHLRRAYAWFVTGFVAAGIAQLVILAVR